MGIVTISNQYDDQGIGTTYYFDFFIKLQTLTDHTSICKGSSVIKANRFRDGKKENFTPRLGNYHWWLECIVRPYSLASLRMPMKRIVKAVYSGGIYYVTHGNVINAI